MDTKSISDLAIAANATPTSTVVLDVPVDARMSEGASGLAAPLPASSGGDLRGRIHSMAEMAHRAIDRLQQSLSSGQQGIQSAQSTYGQKAKQQGETLRERVDAAPLQSIGIALLAGVILDKLFFRRQKVRVVKVPVPVQAPLRARSRSTDEVASGWMQAARARMQGLRVAGEGTAATARTAGGLGLAGTKLAASSAADKAQIMRLRMQLAAQRLLASAPAYGRMARASVQSHPMVGVGASLGLSALLTMFWLQRRRATPASAYITVDEKGNGVAWQHDRPNVASGAFDAIASRPLASGAVLIGLGALVGVLLKQRVR